MSVKQKLEDFLRSTFRDTRGGFCSVVEIYWVGGNRLEFTSEDPSPVVGRLDWLLEVGKIVGTMKVHFDKWQVEDDCPTCGNNDSDYTYSLSWELEEQ